MPTLNSNLTDRFAPSKPSAALHQKTLQHLLLACVLTIALYFVPYAGFVTYPIRLLVTFIHEGSHALVGLLTGALPFAMAIHADASGETYTRGQNVFVASAGYLGATLYGALLIAALRRGVPGRALLYVTAAWVGIETLTLILPALNAFGLLWGVLLCMGLVIAGRKLSPEIATWTAGFIGVQCILNALFDLRTLFDLSIATRVATDAQNMAGMTWIPAPVWAGLWIVTAFGMLWLVLAPAFGVKNPLPRFQRVNR